ncbi:MAG: efflux RND transporter periplasmic adaptor subunit [Pirellulales bacterium]|nr:efflux RND transporter periplasmic adaptor subunit [Pirellulales bacterium]
MNRSIWKPLVLTVLAAGLSAAGCRPQQQMPPSSIPEVAVITVVPEMVTLTSELPGRTSPFRVAEIRPQVNGLLQKRLFTEGSDVKAGEVLYQIDTAPYQAAYDNAVANLESAREGVDRAEAMLQASIANLKRHQATLHLAQTTLQRYKKLEKTRAVTAMQLDQAIADVEVAESALKAAEAQVESDRQSVDVARAAIKQAEAAVETAKINLDYTKITAPISGRIGRSNITEGAIVTAYQAVPLATIQQLDPIFIDVPQSTAELIRLRRNLAHGRLKDNGTDRVKIVLEDSTVYSQEGSLKFRDVTVDPTTGSVILRVVVPNPDMILLPHMFIRAVIDEGVNDKAILIPQQAVFRDHKGNPLVLVVDAEGKVQYRGLTTDRAIGDKWLVSSGLAPGDRVIVEGIQKAQMRARQGFPVKAVPLAAGGAPTPKNDGKPQAASSKHKK